MIRRACLVLALGLWAVAAHATPGAADSSAAAAGARARGEAAPDSAAAPDAARESPGIHMTWRDPAFGVLAAGAVALAARNDLPLRDRIRDSGGRAGHDLAQAGDALGNGAVLAPALLAIDGLARLGDRRGAAAASERIAFSAGVAGLGSVAIKVAVGRWRPFEAPADDARFSPFSRHDSFPSGHATLAFACASALDAETRSNAVRCVAWPAAALVAWARVHDDRHWASDVVAGAALGAWTAREADAFARGRWPRGLAAAVWPARDGAQARVRLRF